MLQQQEKTLVQVQQDADNYRLSYAPQAFPGSGAGVNQYPYIFTVLFCLLCAPRYGYDSYDSYSSYLRKNLWHLYYTEFDRSKI